MPKNRRTFTQYLNTLWFWTTNHTVFTAIGSPCLEARKFCLIVEMRQLWAKLNVWPDVTLFLKSLFGTNYDWKYTAFWLLSAVAIYRCQRLPDKWMPIIMEMFNVNDLRCAAGHKSIRLNVATGRLTELITSQKKRLSTYYLVFFSRGWMPIQQVKHISAHQFASLKSNNCFQQCNLFFKLTYPVWMDWCI